ncbi:MAG TPA: hypothetical protein VIT45_10520 [Allosphingosinicella sp.]
MIDPVGFSLFERIMAADPLAGPPASPPRAGAKAWLAALEPNEPLTYFDSCFGLRPNAGGGDCLFHALAGGDLDRQDIRAERRSVAAERMRMAAQPRANARRVLACLLQTPETRARGIALADRGLGAAGNGTIAALQSVAGMHAGEAEIAQWCSARRTEVLVVDSNGRIARIGPRGARGMRPEPAAGKALIGRALGRGRIALFRTNGHWRRIDAVAGSA